MGIPVIAGDKAFLNLYGITATIKIRLIVNVRDKATGRSRSYPTVATASADRTRSSADVKIEGDGDVESASVHLVAGTLPTEPQELFMTAEIKRGPTERLALLACGPIYGHMPPSFPGLMVPSFHGPGRTLNNEGDSTLVNNTALTRTLTVPTHAKWKTHGGSGSILNGDDVTRAITVLADDGADEIYAWMRALNNTASGRVVIPNYEDNSNVAGPRGPEWLEAGDRVLITWAAGGASAGGTAKSAFNVEEYIDGQA